MATVVRRSGRTRKAVKNYADEQAEEQATTLTLRPAKRMRKTDTTGTDGEDVRLLTPPATQADTIYINDSSSEPVLSEPVKESSDIEAEEPKPKKRAAKKGRKRVNPPPLDGQVRTKPHSKIYPLPERVAAKAKAWHGLAAETRIERTRSKIPMLAPGQQETRLRPYVAHLTDEFETLLERANTQKMFIINRERSTEEDCHAGHDDCPCEVLKIAGSKGDVYTVTISHLPSCTCPVGLFTKAGKEQCCKHIVYALHHVLKAEEPLQHQNAFLTSELRLLFDNAPPLPAELAAEEPQDGNRKALTDDCPICFTPLEDEETVWCRAACGNNIHKTCFGHWAKTRPGNVTCPFCRTLWQDESGGGKQKVDVASIAMPGERSASGYVNVRHLMGYD